MALIVSPNLTVDRTISLPRLVPGAVLRPRRAEVTAGSKGLNVCRVLAALGHPSTLVGFAPSDDTALLRRLFGAEPMRLVEVPVAGALRVATIYLEDDGRITVLNEPGPDVDAHDWQRFEAAVQEELDTGDHPTLVCAGSLPPGAPADAYGRLTDIARSAGARSVVDASSMVLAAGLAHHPDLVTPNLAEAEEALGLGEGEPVDEQGPQVPVTQRRLGLEFEPSELVDEQGPQVRDRAVHAVRALCAAGAQQAIVTAGAAGAAFGDAHLVRWIPGVDVAVRNPIGAGDSFVGGFVRAVESGQDVVAAVARGLATATASCEHPLAGGIDPVRVDELAAILARRMRHDLTVQR